VPVTATADDPAATLACSLSLPRDATITTPAPAVLFIHGTGPAERNYNPSPELDLPRTLAKHLAERGVGMLRCDSRGAGRSPGDFWHGSFDTYVHDSSAMVSALAKEPGVDPNALGIIGHSEGPIVGAVVAQSDPRIKSLVYIAAGARDFREAVLKQKTDDLRREGGSEDAIAAQFGAMNLILDAVRDGRPLPAGIPADTTRYVERRRRWLLSRLHHDVRGMNRALRPLKILVVQGTGDWVTPPEDAVTLRADLAAGSNPDAQLRTYEGLNHHLARARGDQFPGAPIDARAATDIADFTVRALR
jgi:alpha-beta hydrolase superfamily lysophospholipase